MRLTEEAKSIRLQITGVVIIGLSTVMVGICDKIESNWKDSIIMRQNANNSILALAINSANKAYYFSLMSAIGISSEAEISDFTPTFIKSSASDATIGSLRKFKNKEIDANSLVDVLKTESLTRGNTLIDRYAQRHQELEQLMEKKPMLGKLGGIFQGLVFLGIFVSAVGYYELLQSVEKRIRKNNAKLANTKPSD